MNGGMWGFLMGGWLGWVLKVCKEAPEEAWLVPAHPTPHIPMLQNEQLLTFPEHLHERFHLILHGAL